MYAYVHLFNDKPHYLHINLVRVIVYSHFVHKYICVCMWILGVGLVWHSCLEIHKYANSKQTNCVVLLHNLLALLIIINRLIWQPYVYCNC